MLKRCCIVLLIPNFLLFSGCSHHKDHSRDQWLPHKPTAWRTTPNGHIRDAGPFTSVEQDFITEDELDAAIDAGYSKYETTYPEYPVGNYPIALNDDYVLWAAQAQSWVSGLTITGGAGTSVTVCIYTRSVSITDPGACYIKRAPGVYWGVYYAEWRSTGEPLAPALTHELLHTAIGDPNHTSALWSRMN